MVVGGLDITDAYIRARQVEPSMYESGSFKTIRLTNGVKAIIGNKKGETSTSIQSIIFDKKRFNVAQVKAWLKKHGSKFSKAVDMENEKVSLFQDPMETALMDHLEGHLPPLTEDQIEKLMELAGPAEEEEDDSEDEAEDESEDESEPEDETQMKYSRFIKKV